MKAKTKVLLILTVVVIMFGCSQGTNYRKSEDMTAADILGNPEYLAISYGGYKTNSREVVPSVEEIKDDMRLLSAMGVKILRTYNTQQYAQTANILEAIRQLKNEDPDFEMYVMLGAWIECEGAWSESPNHSAGNTDNNTAEIDTAIKMANTYPDIVKIIAVGNEAMVHWASGYYVSPGIILKWVEHLRELRNIGDLPSGIWITSSDNFASWGGGDKSYKTDDLVSLIKAVDYISLHTYPFHDTHYNPTFWGNHMEEEDITTLEKVDAAMLLARDYAISQYQSVADYLTDLGINKAIHIGETGWASKSNSYYGPEGSNAADEYKAKLYYQHMRDWTNKEGMSCFYFEAFDEQWKDPGNALGSENHFGLINLKGEAKFALWEIVDMGVFDGLSRNGISITKTYGGDINKLHEDVKAPPMKSKMVPLETE